MGKKKSELITIEDLEEVARALAAFKTKRFTNSAIFVLNHLPKTHRAWKALAKVTFTGGVIGQVRMAMDSLLYELKLNREDAKGGDRYSDLFFGSRFNSMVEEIDEPLPKAASNEE